MPLLALLVNSIELNSERVSPCLSAVEIFADEQRDPLWKKILKNASVPEAGKLKVPQGPGLGLELNWDVIDKLRI